MMFYNVEIKEEQKEKIFNIFTSFLEENQNIIASYFKETSDKFNQPNYEDCICSIKYKIDNVVFNSFEPCLSMNLQLKSLFFKQNRYFFSYGYYDRIKINKYYDYIINLDEIISAIKGAKYHSEPNLNSLFQIKAINYIINDNSKFGLFILELYKGLIQKKKKTVVDYSNKDENIGEKFSIKIVKGKKYTKDDFETLKKNKEENMKKNNEIKDIKTKQLKHNEKIQYKLCKFDTDLKYDDNFFPLESIYYLNGKKLKYKEFKTFDDYIIHYKGKKHNFIYINNFINVYDLIFTVKNIDENNIITLEQNDISEILVHYSDKDIFNSLLNQNFSFKTDEEFDIDISPIRTYLKGKKVK